MSNGNGLATLTPEESRILAEVSADALGKHVERIASEIRLSGTPSEARSFEYIVEELTALGLDVSRYTCDLLISLPGAASLQVVAPEPVSIDCITHSMAISTPPEGLVAEIVDVGAGKDVDFRANSVEGKIALVDGLCSPGVVNRAERYGCYALIFVNDDNLHQGIVSSLYGSPGLGDLDKLPRSVVVSIVAGHGRQLREMLARGAVQVRLRTEVDTSWRDVPLVTVDIQPPDGGDGTFAFFGTHVDSWDYGAVDNAAGNAVGLELARILTTARGQLRRGVRILFWSGHSHGRYAGSCWYVDNFWQDLYDRAVLAMSIDSPGAKGATSFGGAKVMDEVWDLATAASQAVVQQKVPAPKRPPGGEQPLWRVGVTSLNPMRARHEENSPLSLVFAPSSPWWHHAVGDTVDKVDVDVLRMDAQIYLLALWRVVAAERLPFEYATLMRNVREHLASLPRLIDLDSAIAACVELERLAEKLHDHPAPEANDAMRRLGRILIPVLYTVDGQFEPGPTTRQGFIPGLAGLAKLAETDPNSSQFHALRTTLIRERNRLLFALLSAIRSLGGSDQ